MVDIFDFIQEKLYHKQIDEKLVFNKHTKEKQSISEKIQNLINLGKEKGLDIVFRNRKTNTGDFCFFVYDKRKQNRYLIGYDGDWDTDINSNTSFDSCYNATLKYIEQYN